MTSRPLALVLAGSRVVNKRIGLFLAGLRDSGFEPLLVAVPRRSWSLNGVEDLSLAARAGYATLRNGEPPPGLPRIPSLIVCMHWSVLPVAVLLKWLVGGRLLYDEHDHYELLTLEGAGPPFIRRARSRCIGLVHRWCLPHVDVTSCIHLAGGHLKELIQQHARTVVELHNYASRRWVVRPRDKGPAQGVIAIVYTGGLWREKGCSDMIDAFSSLTGDLSVPPITMHVFGTGDREIERRLRETPGVHFHGPSRYEDILECLQSHVCIGLNLLGNSRRFSNASTNCTKLFEYFATGTAVLASAVGDLPDIVARTGGGWTIEADASAESLALHLRRILADPEAVRRRGKAAAEAVERGALRWEGEWQKLERLGILDLPVVPYKSRSVRADDRRHGDPNSAVSATAGERLVQARCPVCGPREYADFALSEGLKIVRCQGCGLLFVNPRPRAKSVADHFENEYISDEGRVKRELTSFREESLEREALLLRKILPGGGRLLDVGAASGALLRLFQDDPAWKAEGVEPSLFASRYARETLGLTVHTGFLRDQRFSTGTFDVITSLDAFMLHTEPNEDLDEMVRILRPGGFLAIEIPGLWFRLHKNKGLLCRLLYGVPVRLNPREHLYFYSRKTLTRLCERHGLDFVGSHPERSPAYGPRLFRVFTSAYYLTSSMLYRLSDGALNIVPKELIIFRKRGS